MIDPPLIFKSHFRFHGMDIHIHLIMRYGYIKCKKWILSPVDNGFIGLVNAGIHETILDKTLIEENILFSGAGANQIEISQISRNGIIPFSKVDWQQLIPISGVHHMDDTAL